MQKYTTICKNTLKYEKIHPNMQKYTKICKNTQKYAKIHKTNWKKYNKLTDIRTPFVFLPLVLLLTTCFIISTIKEEWNYEFPTCIVALLCAEKGAQTDELNGTDDFLSPF